MYWSAILWYFSLPLLAYISYLLVKYTVSKYEPILEKPVKKVQPKK
jgi:hypothetical protein